MADSYHHSVSSVKKYGGEVGDYIEIHQWFDETKEHYADFRHRALRHHSQGISECISIFGQTIGVYSRVLGENKATPVRWIAEQHIIEDCGFIPTVQDWLSEIEVQPWMNHSMPLSKE